MSGGQWWRVKNTGSRDATEPGIIRAFEEGGATVYPVGTPCDLIVGFLGVTHLVECKTDRAGLTPAQEEFRKAWRGEKPVIARTPPQARKWVKVWRERAERAASLSSLLAAQRRTQSAPTPADETLHSTGGGSWAALESTGEDAA